MSGSCIRKWDGYTSATPSDGRNHGRVGNVPCRFPVSVWREADSLRCGYAFGLLGSCFVILVFLINKLFLCFF